MNKAKTYGRKVVFATTGMSPMLFLEALALYCGATTIQILNILDGDNFSAIVCNAGTATRIKEYINANLPDEATTEEN